VSGFRPGGRPAQPGLYRRDPLGFDVHLSGKCQQKAFVAQQIVEDRGLERLCCSERPDVAGYGARQREEATEPLRFPGQEAQCLKSEGGGCLGINPLRFAHSHGFSGSSLSFNGWLRLGVHTVVEAGARIGAQRLKLASSGAGVMTYQQTRTTVERRGPEPRVAARSVLIVEDNELNMKLFHDLLAAHGYQIFQTRNGFDALELARTHKPDLILMDIQLPEVSGLEVTRWIKDDDDLRGIPVIAVTAFAMKGDEERIRSGGCEAYISKPISVMSFLETVKRFIGPAKA
jgi:two-component system, cell cycle response regulator DivK